MVVSSAGFADGAVNPQPFSPCRARLGLEGNELCLEMQTLSGRKSNCSVAEIKQVGGGGLESPGHRCFWCLSQTWRISLTPGTFPSHPSQICLEP